MNEFVLHIILFLTGAFISSVSQILLKKSAGKSYDNRLKEYLNPLVITAYVIFFTAMLFTVLAYRRIPLSLGAVLECSVYIFVPALSAIFLKERLSKRKVAGFAVIIVGIVVFTIGTGL